MVIERFWNKVKKTETCWLWQGAKSGNGYGSIKHNGKMISTHRFAYEMANGPIPDGLCVLHRCDVRACIRPDHLFLGTNLDNSRDMFAKGRAKPPKGDAHPTAKLTEAQVRSIIADDRMQRQIADDLGVSKATVCLIKQGKTWRHIW